MFCSSEYHDQIVFVDELEQMTSSMTSEQEHKVVDQINKEIDVLKKNIDKGSEDASNNKPIDKK